MSTPEGKVKAWAKNWIKKHLEGNWEFSPRGGPFGKAGTPDIIICYEGLFAAIETKAEGNTTTAIQDHCHREIRGAKGLVLVLTGKDEQALAEFAKELYHRASILWSK